MIVDIQLARRMDIRRFAEQFHLSLEIRECAVFEHDVQRFTARFPMLQLVDGTDYHIPTGQGREVVFAVSSLANQISGRVWKIVRAGETMVDTAPRLYLSEDTQRYIKQLVLDHPREEL